MDVFKAIAIILVFPALFGEIYGNTEYEHCQGCGRDPAKNVSVDPSRPLQPSTQEDLGDNRTVYNMRIESGEISIFSCKIRPMSKSCPVRECRNEHKDKFYLFKNGKPDSSSHTLISVSPYTLGFAELNKHDFTSIDLLRADDSDRKIVQANERVHHYFTRYYEICSDFPAVQRELVRAVNFVRFAGSGFSYEVLKEVELPDFSIYNLRSKITEEPIVFIESSGKATQIQNVVISLEDMSRLFRKAKQDPSIEIYSDPYEDCEKRSRWVIEFLKKQSIPGVQVVVTAEINGFLESKISTKPYSWGYHVAPMFSLKTSEGWQYYVFDLLFDEPMPLKDWLSLLYKNRVEETKFRINVLSSSIDLSQQNTDRLVESYQEYPSQ